MNTTLLIMAAGIGSRFGTGIKQLEPVDDANHIIMDYSIHDAIEAGFNHVVFIIRKDIENEFKEVIGDRIAGICSEHNVTVDYAFQDINDIRSYRNTMEIAQYANRLTGVSDIELFDRHGDAVEEMQFKNLHTALDRVLEKWEQKREDYETEALVLFTEREAEHAFLYLEEKLRTLDPDGEYQLTYMNRDSQNFKKGLFFLSV